MVNMDGGVDGVPVQLDSRELDDPGRRGRGAEPPRRRGSVVLGTYSSALSIPASAAAAAAGLTYWEAGAVADRVTGRALPNVFRVGASGANLGANSATFAATVHRARGSASPPPARGSRWCSRTTTTATRSATARSPGAARRG